MTILTPTRPRTGVPVPSPGRAPLAEGLAEAAGLRPGMRVLDLSGDGGATAHAVARYGCGVVSHDPGRDPDGAPALPFGDASFDAVVSAAGAIDTPDHRGMAGEMLRVCRPRGPVALAVWTPDGVMGGLYRTAGHASPRAGLAPLLWGAQDHLRALLADGVDEIRTRLRTHVLRASSPEGLADALGGGRATTADVSALVRRHVRADESGALTLPVEYLEAVAIRRRAG